MKPLLASMKFISTRHPKSILISVDNEKSTSSRHTISSSDSDKKNSSSIRRSAFSSSSSSSFRLRRRRSSSTNNANDDCTTSRTNSKNDQRKGNNNNNSNNKDRKKNRVMPHEDERDDEDEEATIMETFFGERHVVQRGRHKRNNNNNMLPACLICLDSMSLADLAHPLMCESSACRYNFCLACIESLLEQQQQQQQEPAWLHCPNCRSNLGPTICDTVLLRKVDDLNSDMESEIEEAAGHNSLNTLPIPCSENSNSNNMEQATKDAAQTTRWALHRAMGSDVTLLRDIAEARDREVHFFQTKFAAPKTQPPSVNNVAVVDDHEEWGFEVDLRVGPHESIKLPRECFPLSVLQTSECKADTTLLAGLEGALAPEEQVQLTRYMTSGDTTQLATAAQILATVAESVQLRRSHNSTQSGSTANSTLVRTNTESSKQQLRRPSIYSWVENGKRARSSIAISTHTHRPGPFTGSHHPNEISTTSDAGSVVPVYHHNYSPYTKYYAGKVTEHRQIDRQLRETLNYLRRHPLPVRMPKYVEFIVHFDNMAPQQLEMQQIVKSLPVRFCNDTWDGTILDAFSKIYVTPHNNHYYLRRPGGGASSSQSPYRTGKNYSHRFRPTSTFVNNYSVTHRPPETDGIRHILTHHHENSNSNNNNSNNNMRIDTPHSRILIAAVCDTQARQQGVFPGDVVTHVNGMELRDAVVDDLMALICSHLYHPASSLSSPTTTSTTSVAKTLAEPTSTAATRTMYPKKNKNNNTTHTNTTTLTLQLVLNADQATAEALKLRAMACNHERTERKK